MGTRPEKLSNRSRLIKQMSRYGLLKNLGKRSTMVKKCKKTFLTKYYQDKDRKLALSTDFQNNQQYWSQKINNLGIVEVCLKDDVPTKVIKMIKQIL